MAEVVKVWGHLRLPRWLRTVFEIGLPVAAAIALAASGRAEGHIGLVGFEPTASAVLIAAGALLLLAAALLVAWRTAGARTLEDELPKLRKRAALGEAALLRLMRIELKVLSRRANFHSNERVSLYREEADGFILVARYAAAPPYDRSLGRKCLAIDEGILGQAWAAGSAEAGDLPAPGGDPPEEWLDAQEQRFSVDRAAAAKFAMRSQSYVAFRIETFDHEAQGAIVFESSAALGDFGGGAVTPWMTVSELEEPVKEGGERLAQLLLDSRALGREELRRLLIRLQGPNPVKPQAARSSD
jgi:hypothetical protein